MRRTGTKWFVDDVRRDVRAFDERSPWFSLLCGSEVGRCNALDMACRSLSHYARQVPKFLSRTVVLKHPMGDAAQALDTSGVWNREAYEFFALLSDIDPFSLLDPSDPLLWWHGFPGKTLNDAPNGVSSSASDAVRSIPAVPSVPEVPSSNAGVARSGAPRDVCSGTSSSTSRGISSNALTETLRSAREETAQEVIRTVDEAVRLTEHAIRMPHENSGVGQGMTCADHERKQIKQPGISKFYVDEPSGQHVIPEGREGTGDTEEYREVASELCGARFIAEDGQVRGSSHWLVGRGRLLTLEFKGKQRFAEASHMWRKIVEESVREDDSPVGGLRAFSTFAFADGSSTSSVIVVPELIVGCKDGYVWATRVWSADTPPVSDEEIVAAVRALVEKGDVGECTEAECARAERVEAEWTGTEFGHTVGKCVVSGQGAEQGTEIGDGVAVEQTLGQNARVGADTSAGQRKQGSGFKQSGGEGAELERNASLRERRNEALKDNPNVGLKDKGGEYAEECRGSKAECSAGGDKKPNVILEADSGARAAHEESVREALELIDRGTLEKVVVARYARGKVPQGFFLPRVLRRLAANYPSCWVFAVEGFFGASPETLIESHGGQLHARVLAGTRPRSMSNHPGDAGQSQEMRDDEVLAAELVSDPKELAEHRLAVESVVDVLTVRATNVCENGPFLLELPNVWHLATDVIASATEGDVLGIVAALHPTAAVAGVPRKVALEAIEKLEVEDRGRYAGPVGWLGDNGDGEWAIGLRSAQLMGDTLKAWAGGGIVAGSRPECEFDETEAKMAPIREALG